MKLLIVLLGGAGLATLSAFPAQAVTLAAPTQVYKPNDLGVSICEVSYQMSLLPTQTDVGTRDQFYHGLTLADGTPLGHTYTDTVDAIPASALPGFFRAVGASDLIFSQPSGPVFFSIIEVQGGVRTSTIIEQIPVDLGLGGPACKALAATSNQAPSADAGTDQTNVVPGSTVMLDGSASVDPDHDALTYNWVQISGATVTLSNPNSVSPSFTAPGGASATPIIFQLFVNDGKISSAADSVTITVLDNIGAAHAAIGNFLAERANQILSHQPDIQRRIDRLQGRTSPNGSTVGGAPLPGSQALPLSATASNGQVTARSSLRNAGASGRFDIWVEGHFSDYRYGARTGKATIFYGGVDYAASDNLLLGVMGQYDRLNYDRSVNTGVIDGKGWLAGPYATVRLRDKLFFDARFAVGASRNEVSPFGTYRDKFQTNRALATATLAGEFEAAARLIVRPEASVEYLAESQKGYTDSLNSFIPSQQFEFGQVSAAPRVMYETKLSDNWRLRPYVEVRGIYSFGDNIKNVVGHKSRFRLEGGVDLYSTGGLRASIGGFLDGIGASAYRASGGHLSISFAF